MKTSFFSVLSLVALTAIGCAQPVAQGEEEGASTSNIEAAPADPLVGTWRTPADATTSFELRFAADGDDQSYALDVCGDASCTTKTDSESGSWKSKSHALSLVPSGHRVSEVGAREFAFIFLSSKTKLMMETNETLDSTDPSDLPKGHETFKLDRVCSGDACTL